MHYLDTFRNPSPCRDAAKNAEVSFSIKRALGSRKGWKIMADDGHSIDGFALKTVVNMIKDMEFQVERRLWGEGYEFYKIISFRGLQFLKESASRFREYEY